MLRFEILPLFPISVFFYSGFAGANCYTPNNRHMQPVKTFESLHATNNFKKHQLDWLLLRKGPIRTVHKLKLV